LIACVNNCCGLPFVEPFFFCKNQTKWTPIDQRIGVISHNQSQTMKDQLQGSKEFIHEIPLIVNVKKKMLIVTWNNIMVLSVWSLIPSSRWEEWSHMIKIWKAVN
jgi:hypothetical protein